MRVSKPCNKFEDLFGIILINILNMKKISNCY